MRDLSHERTCGNTVLNPSTGDELRFNFPYCEFFAEMILKPPNSFGASAAHRPVRGSGLKSSSAEFRAYAETAGQAKDKLLAAAQLMAEANARPSEALDALGRPVDHTVQPSAGF